MLRFSKFVILAATLVFAASCSRTARIEGVMADAPSSQVIVKLLDVNRHKVLDTVTTDAAGRFAYKARLSEGQPEFIYLYYKDTKVASLLLEAGDKVSVKADTLGQWSVEGSEESVKLAQVETDYSAVLERMESIAADPALSEEEASKAVAQEYVKYYRGRVKYVMQNPYSLTVIPVFYQKIGDNALVFGQPTDAIHLSNAADSLETVYPESRYVKTLRAEAQKRLGYMELASRLSSAQEVDFLDMELPDLQAQKVKLSDVHSKVTLVYFWTASDAAQKMFNLDVLAPVYEEFHSKGFNIYQVSLDVDKGMWARVAKEQNLPWTNVCDSRGAASKYATLYNVSKLPSAFLIGTEGLAGASFSDAKSLRNHLLKQLK